MPTRCFFCSRTLPGPRVVAWHLALCIWCVDNFPYSKCSFFRVLTEYLYTYRLRICVLVFLLVAFLSVFMRAFITSLPQTAFCHHWALSHRTQACSLQLLSGCSAAVVLHLLSPKSPVVKSGVLVHWISCWRFHPSLCCILSGPLCHRYSDKA